MTSLRTYNKRIIYAGSSLTGNAPLLRNVANLASGVSRTASHVRSLLRW